MHIPGAPQHMTEDEAKGFLVGAGIVVTVYVITDARAWDPFIEAIVRLCFQAPAEPKFEPWHPPPGIESTE